MSIDFRLSKNGHLVPVVDQIYLHSIYDPMKEAQQYVQDHALELARSPCALVLGLGFGYHIQSIIEFHKLHHLGKSRVMVIEFRKDLVEKFIDDRKQKGIQLEFQIISSPVSKIFQTESFLMFLLQKPSILVHMPSYQKDQDFYQELLNYKASRQFATDFSALRPSLQERLTTLELERGDLSQVAKNIFQKKELSKEDHLFLFFQELMHSSAQHG